MRDLNFYHLQEASPTKNYPTQDIEDIPFEFTTFLDGLLEDLNDDEKVLAIKKLLSIDIKCIDQEKYDVLMDEMKDASSRKTDQDMEDNLNKFTGISKS